MQPCFSKCSIPNIWWGLGLGQGRSAPEALHAVLGACQPESPRHVQGCVPPWGQQRSPQARSSRTCRISCTPPQTCSRGARPACPCRRNGRGERGRGRGAPGHQGKLPEPPPLATCTSRASPRPTRSAPGELGSCRLTRWLHQSRALGATRLSGLAEGSPRAARARRAGRSWQKGTTWAFSSRNNRAKVFWAEPCCLLGREDPRG